MPSLSDRAKELIEATRERSSTGWQFDSRAILMADVCQAIESLTESRVVASHNIERLELRIEELEAQLAQLTPPKDIGP